MSKRETTTTRPRPWRAAALLAAVVAAAAGIFALVRGARLPAPPSGTAGTVNEAPAAPAAPHASNETFADAPPPWAIPAAPAAKPAPRPEEPREVAAAKPHIVRRAAPIAYPPAIEDAIHASLESGRSQSWSALGVQGWVTVSAAGGPDHSCRAYRVVREDGASAPQTLCRAADGRWRAG